MTERFKKELLSELNKLETAIYVTEDKEAYWHYVGKQEGIIEALKELGYKVVYKYIEICGDDVMQFTDIESEVKQ